MGEYIYIYIHSFPGTTKNTHTRRRIQRYTRFYLTCPCADNALVKIPEPFLLVCEESLSSYTSYALAIPNHFISLEIPALKFNQSEEREKQHRKYTVHALLLLLVLLL